MNVNMGELGILGLTLEGGGRDCGLHEDTVGRVRSDPVTATLLELVYSGGACQPRAGMHPSRFDGTRPCSFLPVRHPFRTRTKSILPSLVCPSA